jgi:methylmalonyl-CoA mutase N-terminal domain/subunit
MGGSVAAIESGFMQNEIANSAYQHQRSVEQGEKIIVGVNRFTISKEEPVPPFKINDNIRQQQTEKLNALKARRNTQHVNACLEAIRQNASTGENLMPAVIEAVEAYCTLGEISDVLRDVFGEFR